MDAISAFLPQRRSVCSTSFIRVRVDYRFSVIGGKVQDSVKIAINLADQNPHVF